MRLAAVVHLDLELRVLLLDERDEVVHALGVLARQDREDVDIRSSSRSSTSRGDRLQQRARR